MRRTECCVGQTISGTLRNYYDDDNNNVKKQLVLWPKQQLFSTFLLRPLHDYDVKPSNATFCRGRGHTTTNFPFSIWTWIKPLRINSRKSSLNLTNWAVPNRRDQVWKDTNSFFQWCFHCRRRRSCLRSLIMPTWIRRDKQPECTLYTYFN